MMMMVPIKVVRRIVSVKRIIILEVPTAASEAVASSPIWPTNILSASHIAG
jgi:hypothetical protein